MTLVRNSFPSIRASAATVLVSHHRRKNEWHTLTQRIKATKPNQQFSSVSTTQHPFRGPVQTWIYRSPWRNGYSVAERPGGHAFDPFCRRVLLICPIYMKYWL
ncbi:hypothetical protein DPMN_050180 [Dreissena polymorpha]|uniref:Uncharacterized protein n=1 Tax=Dreissena polymorpha TaxID=45954 RepID=A0A9D4CGN6_DREPO|nr:hypothetical protein DPMN_050180 [Dreissena polymorpha]